MNQNLRLLIQICGLSASLLAVGCADDGMTIDAGTPPVDAGALPDSGVRQLCPHPGNTPMCQAASECLADRPKPTNCEFCYASNDSICKLGQCETPGRIEQVQSVFFSFNAPDLVIDLKTFARMAVTAETSGGNEITCDDILNGNVDWSEECYNIIDSRTNTSGGTPGGAFSLLFSQIPSGQKTLFVVYGFSEDGAAGAPIGVTCGEAMVPEKGATDSMMPVAGSDMKSLR